MITKIREKVNIFVAKSPRKAVLAGIMLFNVVFVLIAATIIAVLSNHISGLKECTYWEAVYHTFLMVLDAGSVESVIADVGKAGTFAAIVCIVVVVIGMMFFSGAVIGYFTNRISEFIDSKNNGKNKLLVSDHVVIINWNSRVPEIINEFLYNQKEVKVVVFVQDNRKEIDGEIRNRLDTTLRREEEKVRKAAEGRSFLAKKKYIRDNLIRDKLTVIVREGDVASASDLDAVCISKARTVIILDSGNDGTLSEGDRRKGNTQTVKTLIQVSEISRASKKQTILVEVADDRTENLVDRIIEFKSGEAMETIIPISFNRLLGKTYSNIAVMPELYDVYDNLFSNKGVHFVARRLSGTEEGSDETGYIRKHFSENMRSVPMTVVDTSRGELAFFMASSRSDLERCGETVSVKKTLKLKKGAAPKKKCIAVFGHNSNMDSLMEGFDRLRTESEEMWGYCGIRVVMTDDESSLRKHGWYKDHPYVKAVAANIFDEENRNGFVSELNSEEEATLLVLSDDSAEKEDMDAMVLTYLIYIQEQLRRREMTDPEFDRSKIDVVVEILNPKNEDVVKGYGADKVISSNRYLSRVIAQASRGETVIEFYAEILSCVMDERVTAGKEITIRTAGDFFEELPGKCTAAELIRMAFEAGDENGRPILLGYIRNKKDCRFFEGDQRKIELELRPDDRLVVFLSCTGK